jgi:hypothetical protein
LEKGFYHVERQRLGAVENKEVSVYGLALTGSGVGQYSARGVTNKSLIMQKRSVTSNKKSAEMLANRYPTVTFPVLAMGNKLFLLVRLSLTNLTHLLLFSSEGRIETEPSLIELIHSCLNASSTASA